MSWNITPLSVGKQLETMTNLCMPNNVSEQMCIKDKHPLCNTFRVTLYLH